MPLTFILSKLLWIIVQPGNLLVLLIAVGLLLGRLGRPRAGWLFVGTGTAGFALLILLPVSAWLMYPLEHRFPRPTDLPARVDGIIVLGGAVQPVLAEASGLPALNDTAERMTEGVHLKRLYPEARLVFTGGSGSVSDQRLKEAPVARALWAGLGVDVDDVLFESESRNTYDNALLLYEELQPKPGEVWLLVTSAFHMPRSIGVFRKAGWSVVAYPVDYRVAPIHLRRPAFALESGLKEAELALHEWVGLLAYHLMGRTDSLYPAP